MRVRFLLAIECMLATTVALVLAHLAFEIVGAACPTQRVEGQIKDALGRWSFEPVRCGVGVRERGGDVYSEAITVVVTLEEGELRVRTVEFGRP